MNISWQRCHSICSSGNKFLSPHAVHPVITGPSEFHRRKNRHIKSKASNQDQEYREAPSLTEQLTTNPVRTTPLSSSNLSILGYYWIICAWDVLFTWFSLQRHLSDRPVHQCIFHSLALSAYLVRRSLNTTFLKCQSKAMKGGAYC